MLNTSRLKEEMNRNNLTQTQLADKIGVTIVSMSRYVKGDRTPRATILHKMALALGVTPGYLLGQDECEHPDISFARVRISIREYGKKWNGSQIRELINMLISVLIERSK